MLPRSAGVTGDLFQALVEFSSDAIAVLDERGIIRFSSRGAERLLGYTPAELQDTSALDRTRGDDLPGLREAVSRLLAQPGAPITQELQVRHKDGSWRLIEAVAVNRLADPAVGAIVVNYRAVSERRRAEEAEDRRRLSESHYRSLIQGAAHGLFRATLSGRILDANPALANMLGYESIEELKTVNLESVYVRPDARGVAIEQHLQSHGQALSSKVAWRRKDGTTIIVRLTERLVEPVEIAEQGMSLEGLAEDITQNRALEEQLRQLQKMQALGLLARGIAHDFNNVLAAILGCTELLMLRIKPDDELMIDVLEIGKAAERGAALTKQLLVFSRRQAVDPEVIDVHGVLRGFDSMLQRIAGEVTLNIRTPGPSPRARIEPGQLEQVVMNLVINAREASPAGGAIDVVGDMVTLAAHDVPALPPGAYARVAVHGAGVGVDPEPRRMATEGNGLGLSIVHGIVKDARGAVTFNSLPGQGTTFTVFLPLERSGGHV